MPPPRNTRASLSSILIFAALWLLVSSPAMAGNNAGQAFSVWPDTGQSNCYDTAGVLINPCPSPDQPFYGQDAQYIAPTPSYTKLDPSGNDLPDAEPSWVMVRDNVTGLIWEIKQANDGLRNYSNPHDADNTYTWCDTNPDTNGGAQGTCDTIDTETFIAALNSGSGFGGHTDWRVPSLKELKTLVDRSRETIAICTAYFPDLESDYSYWSSTTTHSRVNAWYVDFFFGGDRLGAKSFPYRVRAVRGGQVPPENRFVVNVDTVTDTATCLEWQRATADNQMTWEDALAYAQGLSLAGHTDWRLPDYNELTSIVDYSRYSPAIDTDAFPETGPHYWSSTTLARYPKYVWSMSFGDGNDYYGYIKSWTHNLVRAVRGGQCRANVKANAWGSGKGTVVSDLGGY